MSDHVFALFHLLGMVFAPRLRDFSDRRLACFGGAKAWPTLSPLIGKPINEEVIRQHWGDIMRRAASIHDRSLKQSEILRKLGAYRQQNRPLGWEHIILSGDFDWHSGAAERKIARPLNIRLLRNWGT